jgi:hypothetical protein
MVKGEELKRFRSDGKLPEELLVLAPGTDSLTSQIRGTSFFKTSLV